MQKILLWGFALILYSCGSDNSTNNEEIFADNQTTAEILQKGNVLFNTNCKICHSLDTNTPGSLAPVLDSINHHWPNKAILAKYIKNAPNMMQENKRSREVYQKWKNKPQMPAFAGLSQEKIYCIIEFLYTNT